jgi:hypothetical protein
MLFSFMSSCSSLETLRLVLCMAVQKGRREQVEVSYTGICFQCFMHKIQDSVYQKKTMDNG